MNKKIWMTAALLGIILCGMVSAQTRPVITIGGSYWNAKPEFSGNVYEGLNVDAGNMFGPYVNLRMGNWLLGTSMFFGSFKVTSDDEVNDMDMTLKRIDLNVSVGYSVHKNFNLFGAVKNESYSGESTFPYAYYDYYYNYYEGEGKLKMENKGTLFGGGASTVIPFSQSPFFLFGSIAYLTGTLNSTFEETIDGESYGEPMKSDAKTHLWSWNGGIGFSTQSGFTIMVGYRGETSGDADGDIDIKGITATIAFTPR